jgi:phosphoribosyl 1,2-cyclic phosphate phosphodiesterase
VAESEIARLQGLEVLVVNALHHDKHYSHFNLEQALQFVETVKPQRAYLTHSSHHMGLYADVAKTLPQNVTLGYDGLQTTIDK